MKKKSPSFIKDQAIHPETGETTSVTLPMNRLARRVAGLKTALLSPHVGSWEGALYHEDVNGVSKSEGRRRAYMFVVRFHKENPTV